MELSIEVNVDTFKLLRKDLEVLSLCTMKLILCEIVKNSSEFEAKETLVIRALNRKKLLKLTR